MPFPPAPSSLIITRPRGRVEDSIVVVSWSCEVLRSGDEVMTTSFTRLLYCYEIFCCLRKFAC